MVSMVVNYVVNLIRQESKLLGKLVEVDEPDAFNLSKHNFFLSLEVIKSNHIFSKEPFIYPKVRQVLQYFKPEV